MSPRTVLNQVVEAKGVLVAIGALVALGILLAGHKGLPERVDAVETRMGGVEAVNTRQDAMIEAIERDRGRMICLLEAIAEDRSPLGCAR